MTRFQRLHPFLLAAGAAALSLGLGGASGRGADPTPPVITPSITGTLGDNGWHRSNVTVGWSVVDPDSGVTQTTGCDTATFTQDTTGVARTCQAVNGAGLTGSYTLVVKIDKTPPAASAALDREPDFGTWHTSPVTVDFGGSDQTSSLASCTAPVTYAGPDTDDGQVTGVCRDRAGNESSASVTLRYDATAPVVKKVVPARRPDRYGWFTRPIRFALQGEDATSGIASCDAPRYAGANSARASVSGTCRDRAGNVSAPRVVRFKYSRPLLVPKPGLRMRAPVRLQWVKVERANLYNVQLWRGKRKLLSVWPRGTSYRLGRTWAYDGRRYALEPGRRYRLYVWPRLGSRYGRLLGYTYFDVVRRADRATGGAEGVPLR